MHTGILAEHVHLKSVNSLWRRPAGARQSSLKCMDYNVHFVAVRPTKRVRGARGSV